MNLQTSSLPYSELHDGKEFLAEIGRRVRNAREQLGCTRRELSLLCGVSERHLAQLETGKGNISLRLLHQIAISIETPLEQLVKPIPSSDQWLEINRKFESLGEHEKIELMQQLEPLLQRENGKFGRVALIGLRGAGKSSIGARCANSLGIPFIELNQIISQQGGFSVSDIFSLYGEQRYRELEKLCLEKVAEENSNFILAVSGGIVSNLDSFERLLNSFHTVWLTARPEEHMGRVMAQGDTRAVEGNPDAMSNLRVLLDTRKLQYQRAQFRLDTSNKSVADCGSELAELIRGLN